MSYIKADDIRSNLVAGFDIVDYLEEANNEVIDVAEKLGIRDTDLISTPVHYKIKRYGVVFVLMRLAQDKIGTNQSDVALEKYRDLYAMYKVELKELLPQLTYQMYTGTVQTITGRTSQSGFYRG